MENLYVETPRGEVLQMCFMRPTPEQLCPQLPFLIEAPELSAAACGIEPTPIAAEDAVPVSAPAKQSHAPQAVDDLFGRLGRALIRGDESLPDVSGIALSDWERALSDKPIHTAPAHKARRATMVMSQTTGALSQAQLDKLQGK